MTTNFTTAFSSTYKFHSRASLDLTAFIDTIVLLHPFSSSSITYIGPLLTIYKLVVQVKLCAVP